MWSLAVGIFRSFCKVMLLMYQGALVVVLKANDGNVSSVPNISEAYILFNLSQSFNFERFEGSEYNNEKPLR